MKLTDHALDPERLKGIWWDYETGGPCETNTPHETHGCFLVVPSISSRLAVVLQELAQPHQETLRAALAPDATEEVQAAADALTVQLRARAQARCILVDWRNIEKPDGTPWPYSEDDAYAIFTERRWLAVAQVIVGWADATDAAKRREEVQAEGN